MKTQYIAGLLTIFTLIAPAQIIYAQTAEINHTLSSEPGETYERFVTRAENLAQMTVESRFEQDQSAQIVKVTIMGESGGAIAPILSLEVSRQNWLVDPNVQSWATYFPGSKFLLGFEQYAPQPTTSPEPEEGEETAPEEGEETAPEGEETAPEEGEETAPEGEGETTAPERRTGVQR